VPDVRQASAQFSGVGAVVTEEQAERLIAALEQIAHCQGQWQARIEKRCVDAEDKWGSLAKRDLLLRQMARDGDSLDEICERFDLGVSAVKNICKGIKGLK